MLTDLKHTCLVIGFRYNTFGSRKVLQIVKDEKAHFFFGLTIGHNPSLNMGYPGIR